MRVTANSLMSWSRVCRAKKPSPSILGPGLLVASALLMPLFTEVPRRRILGTFPSGLSRKFALEVDLSLYHRLCWLGRGYGVCVPMHHLPGALFRTKDARNPQSQWGDIFL